MRIRPFGSLKMAALAAVGCLVLCACHKGPAAADEGDRPQKTDKQDTQGKESSKENAAEGLTLSADQLAKLGIATQAVQSIEYREEVAGYGLVVNHETIAQAVAELASAQATEHQSRSAFARAKRLAGTPGAVSADIEETAAEKAAVDAAALTLTTQRLSAIIGLAPPWKHDEKDAVLRDLANGRIKLVRVMFPLGALNAGAPASLRAAHIGSADPVTGWQMSTVWDAPADASVPGRSFFALLKNSDAREGERLQVWAPVGAPVAGALIPAAAVIMSEGKYWCYIEKGPGSFARTEIDIREPTAEGYFVTGTVRVGQKVVTSSAGRLLAKESNSDAEPD